MVVRNQKRKRKYFGTRRWGVGNIKNARGAGDRGGVGKGGRKHKWTLITAKFPELIGKKGFVRWNSDKDKKKEVTLDVLDKMLSKATDKSKIEIPEYKVLSNGSINHKAQIVAQGFSKKAAEKIKAAGGEAIVAGTKSATKTGAQ